MKNNKKGAAQKEGGAVNAKDSAAAAGQLKKLGEDGVKSGEKGAARRMGYTQNFGAARQGGYAKGAARVNSIMKGAAQGTMDSSTPDDEYIQRANDPGQYGTDWSNVDSYVYKKNAGGVSGAGFEDERSGERVESGVVTKSRSEHTKNRLLSEGADESTFINPNTGTEWRPSTGGSDVAGTGAVDMGESGVNYDDFEANPSKRNYHYNQSFKKAFKHASSDPAIKTFNWRGKDYTTEKAS